MKILDVVTPGFIELFNFSADTQSRSERRFPCTAFLLCLLPLLPVMGCASGNAIAQPFQVTSNTGSTLLATPLSKFELPWSMVFLPNGQLLVAEKTGQLWLMSTGASNAESFAVTNAENVDRSQVTGLPDVQARGQGGLGDVIIHPEFSTNKMLYLSYVERDGNVSGAAVMRATLDDSDPTLPVLQDQEVIWRQHPKVSGEGHYGHRLAFSESGHLFISSGERQKFDPAQDMQQNLGKVVRLNDDGSVPPDNPFVDLGGISAQVWSLGHRNPLGMAFDGAGQLWLHEMGPRGGDELNRITMGGNYGYPLVSNGSHYSGVPIPDHATRPDLLAPAITWSPVISPSGFVIYSGDRYDGWQGHGLIGGLSSQSLVRVSLSNSVREIERFDMKRRIREVEQDENGFVYVLEDKSGGRLLRLSAP